MISVQRVKQPAMPQRQQGAVLVFCLIFLTVLTMMGVSGMESTTLEERMSANMVDHETAFNAAETALQAGEAWLVAQQTLPIVSTDGSTVVWQEDSMDPSTVGGGNNDGKYWWDDNAVGATWWTNNALAPSNVPGVANQPRYLIEEFKTVDTGQSIALGGGESTNPRVFHRITARGWGIANTTSAMVQATFVQTYD
jgi:type IV pilus assembly protein PilX